MTAADNLSKTVYAALERHPGVNLHRCRIELRRQDDKLVLEGEVDSIIAKRLARQLAMKAADGVAILDHLRVRPLELRGDDEILNAIHQTLMQERIFRGYTLMPHARGLQEPISKVNDNATIHMAVENGKILMAGSVESLNHRRLAEVIAWWIPGCVDVDNRLHVVPPAQDHDDEITDAVIMILEKDPWLNATQISVRTQDREVQLSGLLPSAEQKRMAEYDAWYILGVHNVINNIEVRP